jgi:hypothetical protein
MRDEKLGKSLELLKKYLDETPQEEIDAIIDRVDKMNIQGPTMDEYIETLKGMGLWNS